MQQRSADVDTRRGDHGDHGRKLDWAEAKAKAKAKAEAEAEAGQGRAGQGGAGRAGRGRGGGEVPGAAAGRGTGRLSSSALPQLIGCDGSSEIRALSGASAKMLAGLLELDAAQRRKRVFHQMMMNLRFAVQVRGRDDRGGDRGER